MSQVVKEKPADDNAVDNHASVYSGDVQETGKPSKLAAQEDEEWTPEEEKRLVRKIDLLIMPLLVAGFFALQLNRGNIASALTDGFFQDVGITQNQFNIGQQLLSAGIVLIEVPSNLILYRLGPSIWITAMTIAWGLVSCFQAWQRGLATYLALRLLLGLTLGGFIPAALYSLTMWYKRSETSTRFSVFFMGNSVARAASGLVSFGILRMRGVAGLAGWQWLMIIDGLMAVAVGILFAILFPGTPSNTTSLCHLRLLTERETWIAQRRILKDDPTKFQQRKSVTWDDVFKTLKNWTIYPHLVITLLGNAPANAIGSYGPTIINSFGYDAITSNALFSVGSWVQLFLNPVFGVLADRTRRRGLSMMLGLSLWWLFTLVTLNIIDVKSKESRYAVLTMALCVVGVWHPINGSWIALNARNAEQRNVTMAVYIMISNCAGIVGSQVFRQNDGPLYRTGWLVSVGLLSVAVAFGFFANFQYRWLNHRKALGEHEGQAAGEDRETRPDFKYSL